MKRDYFTQEYRLLGSEYGGDVVPVGAVVTEAHYINRYLQLTLLEQGVAVKRIVNIWGAIEKSACY